MKATFLQQAKDGNRYAIQKKGLIARLIEVGDSTIPDLSRDMNLSVPTVTKLIGEMIEEGFVLDFGKQDTNGGRKPNVYGLNPQAGYFSGIDVRMDNVEMALIDFKGQMVYNERNHDFVLENSKESLDRLCEIINGFLNSIPVSRDSVIAVGINISGRVNSESGYSYSYYYVDEQPLSEQIEQRIGAPVFLENDTRAMTYGEYIREEGQGENNVIFVNVSWGMGIGIIIDGKLFYGKSGFSGEYGHFPYYDNDLICRCGKRGCLETEVSGAAVHRNLIARLSDGSACLLADKYNRGEEISLDDIMEALRKEDVLTIEIVEGVGSVLGKAISGLINLFNPDTIIVGGTLSAAKDYIMLPLKSAVNRHSLTLVNRDTVIKFSKLGNKAGVWGACLLVRNKILGLIP